MSSNVYFSSFGEQVYGDSLSPLFGVVPKKTRALRTHEISKTVFFTGFFFFTLGMGLLIYANVSDKRWVKNYSLPSGLFGIFLAAGGGLINLGNRIPVKPLPFREHID